MGTGIHQIVHNFCTTVELLFCLSMLLLIRSFLLIHASFDQVCNLQNIDTVTIVLF